VLWKQAEDLESTAPSTRRSARLVIHCKAPPGVDCIRSIGEPDGHDPLQRPAITTSEGDSRIHPLRDASS
jgi:hypothetical protein